MRVPTRRGDKKIRAKIDPCITQKKYNELKKKLAWFLEERWRLAEDVKRFAENGDFSENAEYQIAKGKLRGLNNRILKTEDLIKRAVIIKQTGNNGIVQLGSVVVVEINGKQKKYQILGSSETNPSQGIISQNSPIGLALIGKRVGDVAQVRAKGGEVEYRVVGVE